MNYEERNVYTALGGCSWLVSKPRIWAGFTRRSFPVGEKHQQEASILVR